MRRLLNCQPDLKWEVKANFLSEFSNSMRTSGYGVKYRREMIQGVIKRYKELIISVESGARPLYRTKQMMREAKLAKGGISSASWHLRGMIKQTVNIPITPGAELAAELEKRIGDMIGPDFGKTKIIEKGGMNLLGGVYRSDPFKTHGCRWNEQCLVDGSKDCMDSNIVYKISCKKCTEQLSVPGDVHNDAQQHADALGEVQYDGPQEMPDGDGDGEQQQKITTCYIGQSGRSLHARAKEHLDGLKRGDPKCPLFKHVVNSHNSERNPDLFEIKKLTSSRTNLHRLISESEHIQNNVTSGLMNSKSEYRNTKIIRMRTHRTIV